IFNTNDGSYRCPSSQQGYSPFTTWTRALAWILLGYAEELEYLASVSPGKFPPGWKKKRVLKRFEEVATAVADYYISECPSDGVPYWDTGAPGLLWLADYRSKPADPFNDAEPVDSSAAAIAAQGFLRLGEYLNSHGNRKRGLHYIQMGLIIARTLFDDPYLSTNPRHQGLLLHSVYHRPNNWDYVPKGSKIPRGESSMWGDYHARELALMILRMGSGKAYRFWGE
ncbi:MAG: glycosyl hydrolase, partial [Ignavibacteriales bacterium]|nr:glycosyl hydrolase [Ignavibacteriales bacterium]